MKIKNIFLLLLLSSFSFYGQKGSYCLELLNKKIDAESLNLNPQEFILDIQTLFHCEFDNIDYQIFMGPQGNMPIIATALIQSANDDNFTFNNIKNVVVEFKANENYSEIRKIVKAQNAIIDKPAFLKNWDTDRQLLSGMSFSEEQINEIKIIVNKNEGLVYSGILLLFSDSLNEQKEKQAALNQAEIEELKKKNPESREWVKGLISYDNYEVGLSKSKQYKKPILLYFTGYACVNGRKMEHSVLSNESIQKLINNNYIFVSLLVDDKKELTKEEWFYSETLERQIKTIGQKNIELQIRKFKSNGQPQFIILDSNTDELSRIGYTNNIEDFASFLKPLKK